MSDKSVTRIEDRSGGGIEEGKLITTKNGHTSNFVCPRLACIFQIQIAISLLSGWNLWFSVPHEACRMLRAAWPTTQQNGTNAHKSQPQHRPLRRRCEHTHTHTHDHMMVLCLLSLLPEHAPTSVTGIFGICGTYKIHLLHYLYTHMYTRMCVWWKLNQINFSAQIQSAVFFLSPSVVVELPLLHRLQWNCVRNLKEFQSLLLAACPLLDRGSCLWILEKCIWKIPSCRLLCTQLNIPPTITGS